MTTGWYAVLDTVEFSGKITVSGDVNLVLCDNRTLRANDGINVPTGSKLTIWPERENNAFLFAESYRQPDRLKGQD